MISDAEKGIKHSASNFLIVNGKNMIKPLDRRSNCRSSLSLLDISAKCEQKDSEVLQNLDLTLKNPTFEEGSHKYTVLNKIFESLKLIKPKHFDLRPSFKVKRFFCADERSPKRITKKKIEKFREKLEKDEKNLPSANEAPLKISKKSLIKKSQTLPKLSKTPEQLYIQILLSIQTSFGYELPPIKKKYRYYIGSGNNDSLVSRVMESKKGWIKVFNPQAANFIWTQVKKKEVYDLLPFAERSEKVLKPGNLVLSIFAKHNFCEVSPLTLIDSGKLKVYNRMESNSELCSKKKLFTNIKAFYESQSIDPFTKIPVTFHIKKGSKDPNFLTFKEHYEKTEKILKTNSDKHLTNLWILKPGELTNRGHGIHICESLTDILVHIDNPELKHRTYILQKYLYRPLLYNNRKFDIRVYSIILSYNSIFQCFFYQDGYLRTSVAEFSLENVKNRFIHLTNDAVQKKSINYGKFEEGNKLSYSDFQFYLNEHYENVNFHEKILPKIENLVKDSVEATFDKLDAKQRLFSFEILGYDFMIDEFFEPWLIEVNTNPCLALSGPYLAELIPKMLRDAFQIALDQIFPSDPIDFHENRFVLIFNRQLDCKLVNN